MIYLTIMNNAKGPMMIICVMLSYIYNIMSGII
jgi:hypothetical protein